MGSNGYSLTGEQLRAPGLVINRLFLHKLHWQTLRPTGIDPATVCGEGGGWEICSVLLPFLLLIIFARLFENNYIYLPD